MTPRRSGALVVVAVLALLTLGSITAASAYWSRSGGGSGTAAAGTIQALTLTPSTATAQLYPGGQAAVMLSITNPNPGSVRVGSLALETTQGAGGFAVDAGHSACGVGSLGFTTQSNGGSGWTVPGGGTLSVTLAGSLTMDTGAANTCQGASFTVYLKAGP
jgi:hypothetical protein